MSRAGRGIAALALCAVFATFGPISGQATANPTWNGPKAWAALPRLHDFGYTASILEGYEFQAIVYDQRERYDRGSYRIDLLGKAAQFADAGVTSLVFTGGHRYIRVTAPWKGSPLARGWYDLGSKVMGPYVDVVHQFGILARAWQTRLTGSVGTYTGTCDVAGRTGNAFRVLYPDPDPTLGKWITGSACIDRASGAPLRLALTLHGNDRSGSPVDIEDRFTVTSVGGVAPIAAPSGTAAPQVKSLP